MVNFIKTEQNIIKILDFLEILFAKPHDFNDWDGYDKKCYQDKISPIIDKSVIELNHRFKENDLGYQCIDGQIMRIDNEFLHQEAVKPALSLLNDKTYQNANSEFLSAFDHYKNQKYKATLVDCGKAFESTMKIICNKRNWSFDQKDTAKRLIEICYQNGLIPPFWQNHFSSLRSMLESAIPTPRNKLSGHGQGVEEIIVPEYLASYMLHMTASTLIFLINAEKALDKA